MATKRKRGRPPEHPDRRESILEAALACFVERGFHGTAIPRIAAEARIAPGTIYHYFDSKEAMVNALYRKWKTEVAQRVFAAFPPDAPPRQQVAAVWDQMVAFALAHPAAFAFIELHNHSSYLDDESRNVDRTLKDFASAMIRRAQDQGVVKSLPAPVLMELVFGAFTGMMRAHWERRIELTPEVLREAEQACWDTVATHC
jgi:AcrR family transcriptional regulator